MAGHVDGEDGTIRNTNVGRTINLEFTVDNATLRLGKHRARATGMILRRRAVLQPRLPLFVSAHGRTRGGLCPEELRKRLSLSERASELRTLTQDGQVRRMAEVSWVDDRVIEDGRRVDVQVAWTVGRTC